MAKRKRDWLSLSPKYKARLERSGVTAEAYESGTANLRAARGHAATPEHPQQAFRRPDLYPRYIRRRHAAGKPLPANIIPEQLPDYIANAPDVGASLPSSIGYPQRFSVDLVTFYRTRNGAQSHNRNLMIHSHYSPNGDVTERSFEYDESEFYQLLRLAKDRGFITTVESGQGDVRIVA